MDQQQGDGPPRNSLPSAAANPRPKVEPDLPGGQRSFDAPRAVVALRVTADLSLEQVAEILGKRVGAVKSLQHRALESLRRRCEEVSA